MMQAQAFFDPSDRSTPAVAPVTFFTTLFGLAGLLMSALIVTGWVALGERANISRRDINTFEWIVIVIGILFLAAAVRTLYGIRNREEASLPWAQWVSFATMTFSFGVALYAAAAETNASEREFELPLFLAAVIFLVLSYIGYRYSTFGSDGSPHQFIGIQLAESPSAGAIIGFLFLFLFFSASADLFLTPTSMASVLTNSAAKGIIAIGVTMLMISGEFDLSVGSILGVSAMVFVLIQTPEGLIVFGVKWMNTQPVGWAIIFTLVFACVMGLVNGLLLMWTRIPSFIITLGTLFAFRAITLVGIAGGRIIRYRDYYSENPSVYIDRWLLVVIPVIIGAFAVYIAYRAIRSGYTHSKNFFTGNIEQDVHVRQLSYDLSPFKTTLGVLTILFTVLRVAAFGLLALWLFLVAYMNGKEIETIGGLIYIAVTIGFVISVLYAFGWFGRQWTKFQDARILSGRAVEDEVEEDELRLEHLQLEDETEEIFDFGTVAKRLLRPFQRLAAFGQDIFTYNPMVIAALAILIVTVAGTFLSANQLFVEREDSYFIDAFTALNGRWGFTGESVTEPLDPITDALGIDRTVSIPRSANFRNAIVWWLLLVLVFQTILARTAYGNATFAVGGNVGAARAQGIKVNRVKVQNFVILAFLCGLAAIFEVSFSSSVDPLKGNTWELEVIAMTVVGGALLTGGYGSIFGTMLGALIFGMLSTGLILIGVNSRALQGVIGITLILAVVLNNASKRTRT
jgi:ribose/xylose/arabinose/galactoside ABC-type transport system permease subunit